MSDTPRTVEANEASDGLRRTVDRLERELAEARAECERLRTALLGVKSYREANPLGGPAKVFDAMADCIRAGDSYEAVLKEYGFVREEDCGLKESE